jgi:hypothetical protein
MQEEQVDDDFNQLRELLETVGDNLVDTLPLLRSRFGVGSVGDLAGLHSTQLSQCLLVDKGK